MRGLVVHSFKYAIFGIFVSLAWGGALAAQDWPALRGADGTGSANPGGILATARNIDLKIRWKKELGSGYSSVVVAGDRVVTCYSDGENDNVICLDKKTGETVWESTIGISYKGENGSFDGPITTPLIHMGLVYALDPAGRFCCLRLEDGQVVWSKELVADFGAKKPLYGFATSPVIADETLILQTGVENKSLAGLDPNTGEIKWEVSNDVINSQSPTVMNFRNRDLVLAAGGKNLIGVEPSSGEILFEFEHQGGNGSAVVPVVIDDHGILLTLDDMFSKTVSLRPGNENRIEASEKWQHRSIKNTYNIPALSGGNLFAYSTRILTCVDPESGEVHWKSREPGDGFLVTIDNHMIINTKQGTLHIARASRDGYDEVAFLEMFDDLCWSVPAYSDNAVFSRNLKEIVCVDIVAVEAVGEIVSSDELPLGRTFRDFLTELRVTDDANSREKIIAEFLDGQDSFPLIEDGIVHFLYRGEGDDVAVASDIFGARQEKKMQRVGDSNLFYYSVRLQSDQRANYMFLVDYQPQVDSLNPRSITSSMYAGEMEFAVRLRGEKPLEMSWFGMADWIEPDYLAAFPMELAGSFTQKKLEVDEGEDELSYGVYLPPGYDADPQTRYRTVYIFAPPGGRELGQLDKAVDNIFSAKDPLVAPAILVFADFAMSPNADIAIVEKLIPAIDKEYRTLANRQSRTTAGFGFVAASAFVTATLHSDLFCGAAIYSPLILDLDQALKQSGFDDLENPMEYYIDWGRYDMFNPHENWDIRDISRQLYELFDSTDNVAVRGEIATSIF